MKKLSDRINAPFTPAQVEVLNRCQQLAAIHPFTCGNDGATLIATEQGWTCPECAYTQSWAHDWMASAEIVGDLSQP